MPPGMTELHFPGSAPACEEPKTATNGCRAAAFRLRYKQTRRLRFGPLQARKALLYAPRSRTFVLLFLGSSAVEHSTVNRMVAGSNPARGAKRFQLLSRIQTLAPG